MTDKDQPDETDDGARAEPRVVTGPPTQGRAAPRHAPDHIEQEGAAGAPPVDADPPLDPDLAPPAPDIAEAPRLPPATGEWETPQASPLFAEAPDEASEPAGDRRVHETDWLLARMEAAAAHHAHSQPVPLEAGPEGLVAAMPIDEAAFEPSYPDDTAAATADAGPLAVVSPYVPHAPAPEPASENRYADFGAFAPRDAVLEAAVAPPAQAETFAEQDDRRERTLRLLKNGARYAAYGVAGYLALVVLLIGLYRFVDPPGSMLMLIRWIGGNQIEQTWVPIERISPQLVRAVVVAEDGRFCDHWGIDLEALQEAIERGAARGASTISMQVVKNMFLWPSKSYVRKIIELPLTVIMEIVWPKRRILEVYLNVAEWGPGVFGAEAAARHHFNKSSARLSENEAALLAASLPNPVRRDAGDPGPRTARKARVIQARMHAAGPAVAACVLGRT